MRILIALFFAVGLQATTVTSITCSGQTATVNSTAHGLIASQGFSLSGSSPTFNSTASTVSANSFTFVLPAGTACSGFTSGYTAVSTAKQIVQLSSSVNTGNATITLNYLFWFTTVYPNPLPCPTPPATPGNQNPTPVCPTSLYPKASAAESAAIVAGTTVEVSGSLTVPANTAAASVQSTVIAQYNNTQKGFSGYLTALGYWWNGVAWTNQ